MPNHKPKILVIVEHYLPGYKAGGPIRTIENMVNRLGDDFEFYILTRNYDFGESKPYQNVEFNTWTRRGSAHVIYADASLFSNWSAAPFLRILHSVEPDIIYINSLFSPMSVRLLFWRRAGRLPAVPVVIAPRGELSPGALQLKKYKKFAWLTVAKVAGLYSGLTWQASSSHEAELIRDNFGAHNKVMVAPDLLPVSKQAMQLRHGTKRDNEARFVFIARICKMKNLDYLLKILAQISGQASLDIYGDREDKDYWSLCQKLIAGLPAHITATYKGSLPHEQVDSTLRQYDFFVLPTLGENFGHAIIEAMRAGCPVVISDQTPWRDLPGAHVGWDISLSDKTAWVNTLQKCIDMSAEKHLTMSRAAMEFGEHIAKDKNNINANKALFVYAAESGAH